MYGSRRRRSNASPRPLPGAGTRALARLEIGLVAAAVRHRPRLRDAPPYHGKVRRGLTSPEQIEEKPLKEACGVFGVYAPGQPVAQLTYFGLFALQHRGQEAAGMAVSDGTEIMVVKEQGLVATVFDDRTLAPLVGHR